MSLFTQTAIALVALVFVLGATTQAQDEAKWAMALAIAVALMIPLRFIFAYLAEPYHLYIETKARMDQLELEKNPTPIFEIWDDADSMTIRDAAYLWCGRAPKEHEDPPVEVYFRITQLRRAAVDENLTVNLNSAFDVASRVFGKKLDHYPETTHVTREDLIDYAELKGERPAFLFPEERHAR